MSFLGVDLETYSSVDIKKSGVYKYVESPDFEIMLIGFKFDNEPVDIIDLTNNPDPQKLSRFKKALTDPGIKKQSYNAQFEITCLRKYFCPGLDVSQWRCTMVEAAMLGLPLGLGQVADVLKLPVQKYNGLGMIKYFCCPVKATQVNGGRTRNYYHHDPAKWNEFKEYCKIDVQVEYAIREKIKFYQTPAFEKPVYAIDQDINSLGVMIDRQLVDNAIRMSNEYTAKLKAEAIRITGLQNPGSVKQLTKWLSEEMEEEITTLRKADVPKLLQKTDSKIIQRVLSIRQQTSKSSVKKFSKMIDQVCTDSRIRGLFQYYGANGTGRFSGRLTQVQNLPRNYMKDLGLARQVVKDGDLELLEMIYGRNTMKVISQLLRPAFIPAPSKKFKVSDFSAIEARVIAWLAGEKWKLDVFNTHGKIYEATASRMFNCAIEDVKKGSTERDAAKISELALGFGGSVGAYTKMIEQEATRAYEQGKTWTFYPTEEEKKKFVDSWRAANPKIKQMWYAVNDAAITAVAERGHTKCGLISYRMEKNILFCRLPSGREIAYMRPKLVPGKFDNLQIQYEAIDGNTKKWSKVDAWYGVLVENIVQGLARDLLVAKMIEFYSLGADMPLHVHDEIVIEDDDTFSLDEINDIMGRPVKWASGLPLKGDSFETEYYKKDD